MRRVSSRNIYFLLLCLCLLIFCGCGKKHVETTTEEMTTEEPATTEALETVALKDAEIGDIVQMGTYEQDGDLLQVSARQSFLCRCRRFLAVRQEPESFLSWQSISDRQQSM